MNQSSFMFMDTEMVPNTDNLTLTRVISDEPLADLLHPFRLDRERELEM